MTASREEGAQRATEITAGYRALPGGEDRLKKLQVNPEEGDAPPWDANTAFQTVGTDVDRGDVSVVSADVFESMRSSRGFRSTCTPGLYTGREPKEVCRAPCTRSAALVPPRMEFPRLVDGSEAESPPPPPALVPAARSALLPTRLSADATGLASTRGSCLIAGDLART